MLQSTWSLQEEGEHSGGGGMEKTKGPTIGNP